MFHRGPRAEKPATSEKPQRSERRADDAAARTAAVDWLHLVDAGKYQEAFALEAQDPHMSRNRAEFIAYMEEHRTPFGRPQSRIGQGIVAHLDTVRGWPKGDYASVLFKTRFPAQKSTRAERVVLIRDTVGWRPINYQLF